MLSFDQDFTLVYTAVSKVLSQTETGYDPERFIKAYQAVYDTIEPSRWLWKACACRDEDELLKCILKPDRFKPIIENVIRLMQE